MHKWIQMMPLVKTAKVHKRNKRLISEHNEMAQNKGFLESKV